MEKHYCSKCGREVDGREMCGFTDEPTCFECGWVPATDYRIAWYTFLFFPLFGLLYWLVVRFS